MNVKLYDRETWNESEAESYREVVIVTPVDTIRVREVAGILHVEQLYPAGKIRW